jgi:hypothetical protein
MKRSLALRRATRVASKKKEEKRTNTGKKKNQARTKYSSAMTANGEGL